MLKRFAAILLTLTLILSFPHTRAAAEDGVTGSCPQIGDTTPTDGPDASTCAPTVSGVNASPVTENSATITWASTVAGDSVVKYGLDSSTPQSKSDQAIVSNHSVTLTGLSSDTTYYYVVSTSNTYGTGSSTTKTFRTSVAPDTTPPVITLSTPTDITQTSATISWNTNEAATTWVEYGTSTTYGNSTVRDTTLQKTHSETLDRLSPGTKYYYRVTSSDAASNKSTATGNFTTMAPDTTPPSISGVGVSNITLTGATISWTTDEVANSKVEYGPDLSYGLVTSGFSYVSNHSVALTQLTSGAQYHYRVTSVDPSTNSTTSGDYTFTTRESTPPAITSVAHNVTATTAVITWMTDENATTQVVYGTSSPPAQTTTENATLQQQHSVTLSSLTPDKTYYYNVVSKDRWGNIGRSPVASFTTPNDTLEPNDQSSTASALSGSVNSFISISGDVDYFWFTSPQAQRARLELAVPGALDYDLRLLDGTTSAELARSVNGTGQAELISYPVVGGKRYLAKVQSANGTSSPSQSYTLTLSYEPPSPMTFVTPAENSTLEGTVTLQAQAPAGVAVSCAIFQLDGVTIGTGTSPTFSVAVNSSMLKAGPHNLTVQGVDSSGVAVTGTDLRHVTVHAAARVVSPVPSYTITKAVELKGTANFRMSSGYFYLVKDGATTLIHEATVYDNPAPEHDPEQWASWTWTPDPGMTGSAVIRFTAYSGSPSYTENANVPVNFSVPTLDPFLASIPQLPGNQQTWIDNMNAHVKDFWTYNGSPEITGHFYSLEGNGEIGCAPVSNPTLNCYTAFTWGTEKVGKLWKTALANKMDPRLYMAILLHEGTGSFNSKAPERGQSCPGGHCPNPNFDNDLELVGTHLVPQKIKAYAYATSFRSTWPDQDIFPYLGWYTPIDRNRGESGVYATHFTWHEGVRANYRALGGDPIALQAYILRAGARGDTGFVPQTFSKAAVWNTNTADKPGAATSVKYFKDNAGSISLPIPPSTVWWLTQSATSSYVSITDDPAWTTAELADLRNQSGVSVTTPNEDWLYQDVTTDGTDGSLPSDGTLQSGTGPAGGAVPITRPGGPSTGTFSDGTITDGTVTDGTVTDGVGGTIPTGYYVMGKYTSPFFRVDMPSGYKTWSTVSGDYWMFSNGKSADPVIRVYVHPQIPGLHGIDQFRARWQYLDRLTQAVSGFASGPQYSNGVPTGQPKDVRVTYFRTSASGTTEYTVVSGMETGDGYVQILEITVPTYSRSKWQSGIQSIITNFRPKVSLRK